MPPGKTASLDVPWKRLDAFFLAVPASTFYHFRDTLGGIFGSHRREFLARTLVDLKGHGDKKGLRVQDMKTSKQRARGFAGTRSFFYSVLPRSKKWRPGFTLDKIQAESFTHSKVALAHEQGGQFLPKLGRFLAIPIGATLRSDGQVIPKFSTPRRFLRGPEKETLTLPKRGAPGQRIIWWNRVAERTASGQPSRRKGAKRRWEPAYFLVPSISLDQRLRYISTWDALAGDRTRRFRKMLGRIAVDVAAGRKF